jgi:hypothetical protein
LPPLGAGSVYGGANPFQPGDFESMGFSDWQTAGGLPPDWQTGMQTPAGYSGPDFFGGQDMGMTSDLFGSM